MSLRVGVQMDPVSILILDCWCFYVCEKGRGNRCLHLHDRVCVYVTLWQQGKLEVISSILLKPLEKGRAAGGKKDKSHRYNGKKKCIITLRASQW